MSGRGRERLIFALDVPDLPTAERWVARLEGAVGVFKVGLELHAAHGPEGVRTIARRSGAPIFLDLKLHDIPATVERAVCSVRRLGGVRMLTVHAAGGGAMLEAAARAAGDEICILGVTRLTSLEAGAGHVVELARIARDAGCGGVVCSGAEATAVRAELGKEFTIVCPGVRRAGAATHDQARPSTPAAAIRAGADYLVVGRPIRDSEDPADEARAIATEIESALL